MAGKQPGFNGKNFRSKIRFVYDMAAPPIAEERATFCFPAQLVYNTPVDGQDVPFDPAATVTRTVPPPVQVPCGVEFQDAYGNVINFGLAIPAKAVITLLDEDYAKVKDCSYVVLRGEKYNYSHSEFPSGLFDVGLYTLHFNAESIS